jgi:hypothetical protein
MIVSALSRNAFGPDGGNELGFAVLGLVEKPGFLEKPGFCSALYYLSNAGSKVCP